MKDRLTKSFAWEPLAVEELWFENYKNNRVGVNDIIYSQLQIYKFKFTSFGLYRQSAGQSRQSEAPI